MMAFSPMRPMVFTLPEPAIPYTSVPKINGAMMDLIRRRKMLLSGASFTATCGAVSPSAMPAAMPMKIQTVSESRLNVPPT